MNIREAQRKDLPRLLELYTHLHCNAMPRFNNELESLWERILADTNHHIIIGEDDGVVVSSCVMVVVPNLTHNQRPYSLVENVVTHEAYRNKGYATRLMHFVKELAVTQGCYKIMLMTGSKKERTWRFYENAGFTRTDKTAFVQWLA